MHFWSQQIHFYPIICFRFCSLTVFTMFLASSWFRAYRNSELYWQQLNKVQFKGMFIYKSSTIQRVFRTSKDVCIFTLSLLNTLRFAICQIYPFFFYCFVQFNRFVLWKQLKIYALCSCTNRIAWPFLN